MREHPKLQTASVPAFERTDFSLKRNLSSLRAAGSFRSSCNSCGLRVRWRDLTCGSAKPVFETSLAGAAHLCPVMTTIIDGISIAGLITLDDPGEDAEEEDTFNHFQVDKTLSPDEFKEVVEIAEP